MRTIRETLIVISGGEEAKDSVGGDSGEAGVIAEVTGLVAEDAAGTAGERKLHCIFDALAVSHKAGEGVCGAPDSDGACADQRGEMHIGRIHCDDGVEAAHQSQFTLKSDFELCHIDDVFAAPLLQDSVFLLASTEKKYLHVVHRFKRIHHLAHSLYGQYFPRMLGEWRYAIPSFNALFIAACFCEERRIGGFCFKY